MAFSRALYLYLPGILSGISKKETNFAYRNLGSISGFAYLLLVRHAWPLFKFFRPMPTTLKMRMTAPTLFICVWNKLQLQCLEYESLEYSNTIALHDSLVPPNALFLMNSLLPVKFSISSKGRMHNCKILLLLLLPLQQHSEKFFRLHDLFLRS